LYLPGPIGFDEATSSSARRPAPRSKGSNGNCAPSPDRLAVFLAGSSAPASYVTRGDRRVMLVRPGPAIEPHLLGIESILPIQVEPHAPRTGERALLARLLVDALGDAGLLAGGRGRRRLPRAPRPQPAARWLEGALSAAVALPVSLVCDALGLDAGALSAAVPAHTAP
jgi:hypothetical protein